MKSKTRAPAKVPILILCYVVERRLDGETETKEVRTADISPEEHFQTTKRVARSRVKPRAPRHFYATESIKLGFF